MGYDPADPFTVAALNTGLAGSYQGRLSDDGLQGARIGLVRDVFGASDDPEGQQINALMEQAVQAMRGLGAELVDPVTIPDLEDFIVRTSLYLQQSKHDINAFLATRSGNHTVEELYQSRQFHPMLDLFAGIAEGPAQPEDDPNYFSGLAAREMFQRAILNVLASHRLDALVYPDVRVLPPRREELHSGRWTTLTFPTNTLIAPQADLPAVSVPAGFTEDGVPVGLELVGKPYAEPTLLRLAYAFEQGTHHRQPPTRTPPLPDEAR